MITSYKDLTVGKYLEMERIALDVADDAERNTALLSVLTGRPSDELLAIPINEYKDLNRRAAFLLVPPDTKGKSLPSYKCGGMDLVPVRDFKKVTAAQYIDFQAFVKRFPDDSEGIPYILSCFLVPRGKRYCDGYDPEEVQDAIRNGMNVEDALSLHRFFFRLFVKSTGLTTTYLAKQAKRIERRMERAERTAKTEETAEKARDLKAKAEALLSLIDGDGLQTWTPFRRLAAVIGIQSGE